MNANSPPQLLKDRYRLIELLGSGGQASVYLAHDETLDRRAAIKFLSPAQIGSSEDSERFLREARAIARLSHPNIMTLFDMGREQNWHFLVLEYIPGTNLHRMMKARGGPLPMNEALSIISDTLKALDYAHGQGLIHRDIKPENIMITPEGQVKLADFGLALAAGDVRLTRGDVVVGTALYMAPEMITGKFDHRADLYAVGAVLYEAMAGRPAFSGDSALQILSHALNNPLTQPRIVNPGIPEAVEAIILRLMQKNPDERYASAAEVLAALPRSADLEAMMREEIQRSTSERLSRPLLERLIRSTGSLPYGELGEDAESETDEALIQVSPAGEPEPLAQDLLLFAAQEDTVEALEAERRNLARLLQELVINPLNLMLSQANTYEMSINHPQARMAISVLTTLTRQALQQSRDLEASLHPAILESLGLEPALEALAGQEMRSRGLHVSLAIQRMRERLPAQIELSLFRATQDAVDRAARQSGAARIMIRLEKREEEVYFSISDDGLLPNGEILRSTRQRVEAMGGVVELHGSSLGGLEMVIRYLMESAVELTEREMDVIRLVAEGLSNKEIAALLYLSPRTVKFHLDNIYGKLGINTRTEAAIYALRRGWVRQTPIKTD